MAELFEEMTEYWQKIWGMPYSLPGFYQVLWPYAFVLQRNLISFEFFLLPCIMP